MGGQFYSIPQRWLDLTTQLYLISSRDRAALILYDVLGLDDTVHIPHSLYIIWYTIMMICVLY